MAARFVEERAIKSVDDLTEVQREQLRLVGKAWDGQDLSAADRLRADADEEEGCFLNYCNLWKIADGSKHLYDAWFVMADSGKFFRANTTEPVASIVQFGLECHDPEIRLELGVAMVDARLLPPSDSSYAEFAKELSRRRG